MVCVSFSSISQRLSFQQSEDRAREHEDAKTRLQREIAMHKEREAKFQVRAHASVHIVVWLMT